MKTQYIVKTADSTIYYSDPNFLIRHREDGPAAEVTGGSSYYFLNNQQMTEAEFLAAITPKPEMTPVEAALEFFETGEASERSREAFHKLDRRKTYTRLSGQILTAEVRRLQALLDTPQLPPLPDGLPPLPEGAVYLGRGCSFVTLDRGLFYGWSFNPRYEVEWEDDTWEGDGQNLHYAAPAGSEIVKLNQRAYGIEKRLG